MKRQFFDCVIAQTLTKPCFTLTPFFPCIDIYISVLRFTSLMISFFQNVCSNDCWLWPQAFATMRPNRIQEHMRTETTLPDYHMVLNASARFFWFWRCPYPFKISCDPEKYMQIRTKKHHQYFTITLISIYWSVYFALKISTSENLTWVEERYPGATLLRNSQSTILLVTRINQ